MDSITQIRPTAQQAAPTSSACFAVLAAGEHVWTVAERVGSLGLSRPTAAALDATLEGVQAQVAAVIAPVLGAREARRWWRLLRHAARQVTALGTAPVPAQAGASLHAQAALLGAVCREAVGRDRNPLPWSETLGVSVISLERVGLVLGSQLSPFEVARHVTAVRSLRAWLGLSQAGPAAPAAAHSGGSDRLAAIEERLDDIESRLATIAGAGAVLREAGRPDGRRRSAHELSIEREQAAPLT